MKNHYVDELSCAHYPRGTNATRGLTHIELALLGAANQICSGVWRLLWISTTPAVIACIRTCLIHAVYQVLLIETRQRCNVSRMTSQIPVSPANAAACSAVEPWCSAVNRWECAEIEMAMTNNIISQWYQRNRYCLPAACYFHVRPCHLTHHLILSAFISHAMWTHLECWGSLRVEADTALWSRGYCEPRSTVPACACVCARAYGYLHEFSVCISFLWIISSLHE